MTASAPAMAAAPRQWRLHEWPGRLFDLGVIAGLLVVGAAIVVSSTNQFPRLGIGHIPLYAVGAVALAGLLVRRLYPLLTLVLCVAGIIVDGALGSEAPVVPMLLVGVYTVAARLPWRLSLPLAAVSLGAVVAGAFVGESRGGDVSLAHVLILVVTLGAAYVVGVYAGTRTAYIESLRAQAQQTSREQELRAEQAVAEERVRIARELHDVVAHHLSLITVQAGALQAQLPPGHPARDTAASMAGTGRVAMDEMRRMLGLLRLRGGDEPGHAPQPGMDEIPALIAQARAAGVDVEMAVDGESRDIPVGVSMSAYRIVQEAITNVVRHARAARCRVRVHVGESALELRITDDGGGGGADPVSVGPGHGLVGMRERVHLFGGELFAGPVPGGGFAVQATLPLPRRGVA